MTLNAVKETIIEVAINIAMILIMFMIISVPVYAKSDTDVPKAVAESAEYYGGMYGIDPNLIIAICFAESSYIPTVENGSCKGIMEVNTDIHQDVIEMKNITDIYDINQNINCGTWVLYQYMQDDDDIYRVLMKYNGDKTGLRHYAATGEPSEYATSILELANRLKTQMQVY